MSERSCRVENTNVRNTWTEKYTFTSKVLQNFVRKAGEKNLSYNTKVLNLKLNNRCWIIGMFLLPILKFASRGCAYEEISSWLANEFGDVKSAE